MSSPRPDFRAAAAERLAEDGGALPPSVQHLLSDSRHIVVLQLPIDQIELRPERRHVRGDPSELERLAMSVRHHGVLEPVLVRPLPDSSYELVAGERRWRAARIAGLETILAFVREMNPETARDLVATRHEQARARTRAAAPMVAATVGPREPRVISGPRIPDPGAVSRNRRFAQRTVADRPLGPAVDASARAPREPLQSAAKTAEAVGHRARFRFSPLAFLRRDRSDANGDHPVTRNQAAPRPRQTRSSTTMER
jgi:hypothetical protein